MCRGLGRLQSGIVKEFDMHPGSVLRAPDLCRVCFPGAAAHSKKHLVAAHRAARRLVEEYPHCYERVPGRHGTIYTDATHTRSLAIGRIYGLRKSFSIAQCQAELDDPNSDAHQVAQPGGYLALVAERNRLWADELYEEAKPITRAIDDIIADHQAAQSQGQDRQTTHTEMAA